MKTLVLCRRLLCAFILICRLLSASSLKIRFFFIATPTRGPLAVQVRLTAQVNHTVKQELHCGLTGLDVLRESQRFLHLAADLGEAVLELLVAVVLAFATGLVAPVVVVAALCQGRDANIKLNTK